MEGQRFDNFTRLLSRVTPRRRLLGGLALSPFAGLVVARPVVDVVAKKKRKKKGKKAKKPQPNAYGCLDVGKACGGDGSQCCSGICEGTQPKKGKNDTSRCVGHDAGICTPSSNACTGEGVVSCNPSNADCYCMRTTGNATFCGNTGDGGELDLLCRDCSQDTDCEAEFGPGAACVVFDGICESVCLYTGGTACVPVCLDVDM